MRQAIVVFPAKGTGAGTQTVTGVADAEGAFVGKIFLFQSCFAVINTLTAGAIPTGGYSDFRGIDTGSVRSLWANSEAYSPFNFKAADTGQSLGDHSLMDIWTDNFGQGEIYRTAKISAVRSGEFDLLYDGNLRTGDDIICIVLGGDDIDFTFTNNTSGTYATPTKPQGLMSISCPIPSSSGGTAWGTGGMNVCFGFATRDGDYGMSDLYVVNQGNNFSAQLTDTFLASIDGSGALTAGVTVSAWDDSSITIANPNGVPGGTTCIVSGANILCAGGSITAGAPSFDPGIWAKIIFFYSTGYATSGSVQSPIGQMARGYATADAQAGFWSGERTNGNTGAAFGARYLSDSEVIRLTTNPNAGSTTFSTIGSVASISQEGPVGMTWGASNGEQINWFAIGVAAVPPVPPEEPIIGCVAALPN